MPSALSDHAFGEAPTVGATGALAGVVCGFVSPSVDSLDWEGRFSTFCMSDGGEDYRRISFEHSIIRLLVGRGCEESKFDLVFLLFTLRGGALSDHASECNKYGTYRGACSTGFASGSRGPIEAIFHNSIDSAQNARATILMDSLNVVREHADGAIFLAADQTFCRRRFSNMAAYDVLALVKSQRPKSTAQCGGLRTHSRVSLNLKDTLQRVHELWRVADVDFEIVARLEYAITVVALEVRMDFTEML